MRRGFVSPEEREFNLGIGASIEERRNALLKSKRDLAEAAGLTMEMYYNYVGGYSRWPVYRLLLIARALEVNLEQLLGSVELRRIVPSKRRYKNNVKEMLF